LSRNLFTFQLIVAPLERVGDENSFRTYKLIYLDKSLKRRKILPFWNISKTEGFLL